MLLILSITQYFRGAILKGTDAYEVKINGSIIIVLGGPSQVLTKISNKVVKRTSIYKFYNDYKEAQWQSIWTLLQLRRGQKDTFTQPRRISELQSKISGFCPAHLSSIHPQRALKMRFRRSIKKTAHFQSAGAMSAGDTFEPRELLNHLSTHVCGHRRVFSPSMLNHI